MKLVRYRHDPWKSLWDLSGDISSLFDFPLERFSAFQDEVAAPTVDVYEDEENIYVDANLPGFEQKDINVSVKGGALTISAKQEKEKEEKKKGYLRRERFQGEFYRQLYLPKEVDSVKIKATHNNGVLKLSIPKKEKKQEEEIKIEVN